MAGKREPWIRKACIRPTLSKMSSRLSPSTMCMQRLGQVGGKPETAWQVMKEEAGSLRLWSSGFLHKVLSSDLSASLSELPFLCLKVSSLPLRALGPPHSQDLLLGNDLLSRTCASMWVYVVPHLEVATSSLHLLGKTTCILKY